MVDKKKTILKEIMSWISPIAGAFILVLLINTKVFAMVQVHQSSMENTLHEGQKMVIDKISYNFSTPKRGDIIVFLKSHLKENFLDEINIYLKDLLRADDSYERLVKRVIGIPGDKIDIKDGYIYVNDEKLKEVYVKGNTSKREFTLPAVVPEGKLFVLGDNRQVSEDSRTFGFVDLKKVEGKAKLRVWPLNNISILK
ncbi:signal peptidase I [Desnuesiella massiliensis]|uniref:signal peptidase I n=1 Tax=Desnuesiella massiliensis TaxID=1650662 RepID=UPI0006E4466E|nr:signal peptidase I [Desnuesiella massiliensis]